VALLRMDSAIPEPGTKRNCLLNYCSPAEGQQQLCCANNPNTLQQETDSKNVHIYLSTCAHMQVRTHAHIPALARLHNK
jgi:hypothetical protein